MRISDWSSDVCSADLTLVAMPLHRHADVRIFRQPRGLTVEDRARLRIDIVLIEIEMDRVGGHRLLEISRRTRGHAGGRRAGGRRRLLNRRRRLALGRRQRLGTLLVTTGNRDERGADYERCRKFVQVRQSTRLNSYTHAYIVFRLLFVYKSNFFYK